MMIARPATAECDLEGDTVTLRFTDNPDRDQLGGEWHIRGGICWPMMQAGAETVGFALVLGTRIKPEPGKPLRWVFGEHAFIGAGLTYAGDRSVADTGAQDLFRNAWASLYCRSYYWGQDYAIHQRFYRDTMRIETLHPPPVFRETQWSDDDRAMETGLWSEINRGVLWVDERHAPQLLESLRRRRGEQSGHMTAPIRALAIALNGHTMNLARKIRLQHRKSLDFQ
jgi:hypothetical protein